MISGGGWRPKGRFWGWLDSRSCLPSRTSRQSRDQYDLTQSKVGLVAGCIGSPCGENPSRQEGSTLNTIFTPETILRWHRELVAQNWDHSDKREPVIGRPAVSQEIADLVLKFARENPSWGYDWIQGALANIGHDISDQTIGNILKQHGIEPAPERSKSTNWGTFLKAHWKTLAAIDFTTTEVWTLTGLVTMYILVVMDLKSRRVHVAGTTAKPDGAWVRNMARNLTDDQDGFLKDHTHILVDRGSWSVRCSVFRRIVGDVDFLTFISLPATRHLLLSTQYSSLSTFASTRLWNAGSCRSHLKL